MGQLAIDERMTEQMEEDEGIFDKDSDEENEDDCPFRRLWTEEKRRIRMPWKKTLIVKVLGWHVGYAFLIKCLNILWKIQSELTLADLGNDFFLARFLNEDDYDFAFFEGPWMVVDDYLTV